MVESWVEPAISASEKTIMIIAGSASEAIITSRLEPMPPKLVPTSMPASARKKRALPSSAMMAIRSADQLNSKPGREGRDQGAGRPRSRRRPDMERCGTARMRSPPARPPCAAAATGRDRAAAVAALPAQQRAFTLRTKPVSSGASKQHQQHLRALDGKVEDHCHSASTSSSNTSVAEDQAEIAPNGQELQVIEPIGESSRQARSARR